MLENRQQRTRTIDNHLTPKKKQFFFFFFKLTFSKFDKKLSSLFFQVITNDFKNFARFDSKLINSENGLKWSVIKIICDSFIITYHIFNDGIQYLLTKLLSQAENIMFPNRTEADGVSVEIASSSIFPTWTEILFKVT